MRLWQRLRRAFDRDKFDRLKALDKRMTDDHAAVSGAVQAFKRYAGEHRR